MLDSSFQADGAPKADNASGGQTLEDSASLAGGALAAWGLAHRRVA